VLLIPRTICSVLVAYGPILNHTIVTAAIVINRISVFTFFLASSCSVLAFSFTVQCYHKRIHILPIKLWSIHCYHVVDHHPDSVHYHHKSLFWYQHHCHIFHCNSLYRNLNFRNHNPLLWCHMCYCNHHHCQCCCHHIFRSQPCTRLHTLWNKFVTGWPYSITQTSQHPSKEPVLLSS